MKQRLAFCERKVEGIIPHHINKPLGVGDYLIRRGGRRFIRCGVRPPTGRRVAERAARPAAASLGRGVDKLFVRETLLDGKLMAGRADWLRCRLEGGDDRWPVSGILDDLGI